MHKLGLTSNQALHVRANEATCKSWGASIYSLASFALRRTRASNWNVGKISSLPSEVVKNHLISSKLYSCANSGSPQTRPCMSLVHVYKITDDIAFLCVCVRPVPCLKQQLSLWSLLNPNAHSLGESHLGSACSGTFSPLKKLHKAEPPRYLALRTISV